MENIRSIIDKNGFYLSTIVGVSMWPLLRQKKDSVLIKKVNRPLRKYDVILFERTNGQLVLHRLVKIKDGKYYFCGDNQSFIERGIHDENIIGIMDGYYRKEKYHSVNEFVYKIYSVIIVLCRPIRYILNYMKCFIKRIFKKRKK